MGDLFEPLETRQLLSGSVPATPELASASYLLGNTYFTWKDPVAADGVHSVATQYYIEESSSGTGNWTSLPAIDANTAAAAFASLSLGDARLVNLPKQDLADQRVNHLKKYAHDRQKYYHIYAVDADGDSSAPTPAFKVLNHPEDDSLQASAAVQPSGAIRLSWDAKPAAFYSVYRRDSGSAAAFQRATPTTYISTNYYVDSSVIAGKGYEYSITAYPNGGTAAQTYLTSGNGVPAVENRGKIVLLIDDAIAGALRGYIARLQSDLVGDGWTVLRHNVYRNQTVNSVKAIIHNDYDAFLLGGQSDVRQVMLLGHVPIPYSGDYATDGHGGVDDHRHYGAWATDAYYGDMDGVWTDNVVNTTVPTDVRPFTTGIYAVSNAPGDGHFDQNRLTNDTSDSGNILTAPELAVGRIDMYDMPLAGLSEVELLKRYLRKDHEYRSGAWNVRNRAIVYDNWQFNSMNAYSTLPALVGSANVDAGDYFDPNLTRSDAATNRSYLYGLIGGAGYDPTQLIGEDLFTSNGGGAGDFLSANTSPDVVFGKAYASFVTDWHHSDSFLRAGIAGPGYGLSMSSALGVEQNFWRMGMGESVGDNYLFTQQAQPGASTSSLISVDRAAALMGDPTLRMAVVRPPTDVHAAVNEQGDGVFVEWTPSPDASVGDYKVFRGSSMDGPFVDVSDEGNVTNGYFIDEAGTADSVYMVRAVKIEQGNTGSYFNLSQGAFSRVQSGLTVGIGRTSRAYVGSVSLTFNQAVTLDASAVTLTKRVHGGDPVAQNFGLSMEDDGLSWVVTLLDAQNHAVMFGDGVYDVQVISNNVSLGTTSILLNESDHSYMFYRFAADADGDGGVSINDFNVFAREFGGAGADSDSDGDGGISINDFNDLASHFGLTVWSLA